MCYRKQRAVDENEAAVGSQNSEFPFYEAMWFPRELVSQSVANEWSFMLPSVLLVGRATHKSGSVKLKCMA